MIDLKYLKKIHVLVVGDVMLDRYWLGEVERISPEAPVPVVKIGREQERPGGAANVASNVKALGARCTLLSVVGTDDAGKRLISTLDGSGVETIIKADANTKTTVKLRILSRNQQLLRADFESVPSEEVLAACLDDYSDLVKDVDAVILSDYGKGGLRHIVEMINRAKEHDVPVMVDPKGADFERYRSADLVTPNYKELEFVVGGINSEKMLHEKSRAMCKALGLGGLLVTRSERGMTLFRQGVGPLHSPARAREVFDVSGAGDTVISAATIAHCLGLNDADLLSFANAAAGVVVGKLGVASATLDEINEVLQVGDTQ